MESTLTGRDAVEAFATFAALDAAGARFDGRLVSRLARSRNGRTAILAGLSAAKRLRAYPAVVRLLRAVRGAQRAPHGRRRVRASRAALAAPARPGEPRRGAAWPPR